MEDERFYGDTHDLVGCTDETMNHLIEFARERERVETAIRNKQEQPKLKAGDFIDYDNKRWYVNSVNDFSIKLININPLDREPEIRATDWKRHIKNYTVVAKSEVDMSTLKPKPKKPSLLARVEEGKVKAREAAQSSNNHNKTRNKKETEI